MRSWKPDRARPGTAEHLAALPGITVLELDLPAALAVARHDTWAAAHCQCAAQPTPDRPDGAVIATTAPGRWIGEPVRVLDLTAVISMVSALIGLLVVLAPRSKSQSARRVDRWSATLRHRRLQFAA